MAAVSMYTRKAWATRLLIYSGVILTLSFIGLLLHINSGGLYETQTVKAMIFRISITALFAGISWYNLLRQSLGNSSF
jgi:hypothetical protein